MVARHRRQVLAIGALVLAAGATVAVAAAHTGSRHAAGMSMRSMATASAPNPSGGGGSAAPAGTPERFTVLTAQHSNSCGLQKQALMRDTDTARLQGSCCTAMNLPRYQAQVAALRAYRADPVVPADPYDVPAGLAKRLIGDEHTIVLTTAQHAIYTQATRQTAEKGPCCCHCWRWDAFSGLSNYLITRKDITPSALGQLIGHLDGCGGAA